jgi:hypothetical protein
MRRILLLLLLAAPCARAHDHIEVGQDPLDAHRLGLDGPDVQLALYVPPGEPFSGYVPNFPGDWHASELTFTAEANALEPAAGADPSIDVLSVSGPAGAHFAFWEVGATSPTWEIPAGWTNSPSDTRSFPVIVGGETHLHGRAFTMDAPGTFAVVFQARDMADVFTQSVPKTITFSALLPPRLSVHIENESAALSFTSRLNLDYDLQSCTNLAGGGWVTQVSIFGDGSEKSHTLPLASPSHTFYRLVEY